MARDRHIRRQSLMKGSVIDEEATDIEFCRSLCDI